MNTYQDAIAYIEEKNVRGSVLGLDNVKALLSLLGNPQDQLKVIHIAGTNGKGSILAMVESVMKQLKLNVGRYVSPTISTYLERFQISGRYMSQEEFLISLRELIPYIEQVEQQGYMLTAFEIETVLAFYYFKKMQVDLVLLETGMGGRLDATNVVAHPICTVIAAISLDHIAILGDTVEAIAREKCGILRTGTPCVVYPLQEGAMAAILRSCQEKKITPIIPDVGKLVIKENTKREGITEEIVEEFAYENVIYKLGLLGEHQIYNGITAIEVIKQAIQAMGIQLDNDLKNVIIQQGLQKVTWPGRFELLGKTPWLIRDGAHNLAGAKALRDTLIKHFTKCRFIYIIGMLRDKDVDGIIQELCPLASEIYAITVPANSRSMTAGELAEKIKPLGIPVETANSPEEALEQAYRTARPEDAIVAFGSLYYIGRIGELHESNRTYS